jgi:dihydropteroate synthase
MYTINCKGKIVVLDQPLVMGIINATPDSFYKENDHVDAIDLAEKMVAAGAGILDIGGQSTRPGSERVTAAVEASRVLPVIESIHARFPDTIISVDTYYSTVARAAIEAGAAIINDISSGNIDGQMIPTAAALKVPYICMHMQGTPENMQHQPYYQDVVKEVLDFFIEKMEECKKAGIQDIIIDPGFGFGKTIAQNFTLLKNLQQLHVLNKPVVAGLSRKSTIYKTLHSTAPEALNGTTVLNTVALLNGANILRVHDVKEAKEAILLVEAYKKAPSN